MMKLCIQKKNYRLFQNYFLGNKVGHQHKNLKKIEFGKVSKHSQNSVILVKLLKKRTKFNDGGKLFEMSE